MLSKVQSYPNICAVEFDFDGQVAPSNIDGFQPFNNSIAIGTDFSPVYAALGSIRFSEESNNTTAGTIYTQKLSIQFPATDKDRANRFELLQLVKFVAIKLTNNTSILLGRNDYKQNARPKIKITSNEKTAVVEIQTISMFPCGFVPYPGQFSLPTLTPINFINLY